MSIAELEEFFQTYEIPPSITVKKAIRINDTKEYIQMNMQRIKSYKGDISKYPTYWHLCDLYEAIKESMIKKEAF